MNFESSTQHVTTVEKKKIIDDGIVEKSLFQNKVDFFREFWYDYGILKHVEVEQSKLDFEWNWPELTKIVQGKG